MPAYPLITYTGKLLDAENPLPEDISIVDIAHALGNLCRFSGNTSTFYSVAQHSIRVSEVVPLRHQLQALLHDATEAYVADVPKPIKAMCPDYQEVEATFWKAIAARFDLPLELHPLVKKADEALLRRESREFTKLDLGPADLRVIPPIPDAAVAAELFIQRYYSIKTRVKDQEKRSHDRNKNNRRNK